MIKPALVRIQGRAFFVQEEKFLDQMSVSLLRGTSSILLAVKIFAPTLACRLLLRSEINQQNLPLTHKTNYLNHKLYDGLMAYPLPWEENFAKWFPQYLTWTHLYIDTLWERQISNTIMTENSNPAHSIS